MNYTDGTSQGSVYTSDANMQILEGVGLEYPFSGTPFSPRMWNGTIYYSTATGGASTFSWNTGATTQSIDVVPTTNTTYTVDVTIPGCPSTVTESADIEVSDLTVDLGGDTTICVYNSITFDPGNDPADTYSWSTGATTSTITIDSTIQNTGTTDYIVSVTDDFGCLAIDTVALTVDDCLSIFDKEKETFAVYPNPASDVIHFTTTLDGTKKLLIYDLTGAVLNSDLLVNSVELSLIDFNSGMYIYKVFDEHDDLINSGKFVVKR